MFDPYYRTIKGFISLIEKEWLVTGHKFRDRLGYIYPWCDSETSPVFVQFIDCVYQITRQYPSEFEFNSQFLLLILQHLSSGWWLARV